MTYKKDLSIVISLFNEEESLPELIAWIEKVMDSEGYAYEVIMVDDGSRDGSWNLIKELSAKNPAIRGISFRRNYGKSAALFHGFKAAEGRVVITMDADLQDSPDEIPELYRMIVEEGYDIVSGWKKQRFDNKLTKNLPSKLYNWTARKITGIKLHDMNCGLKAYRNEVVKNIEVYGEMHRYIPYLAKNAGFDKITEKPVQHQKRKYGKSKFGLERFVNGFLDLISLWFLSTFGKKPMHFFGFTGLIMFLAGGFMTVWVIAEKLIQQSRGLQFRPVTEQPLFYLALIAVILGFQLFLAEDAVAKLDQRQSEILHGTAHHAGMAPLATFVAVAQVGMGIELHHAESAETLLEGGHNAVGQGGHGFPQQAFTGFRFCGYFRDFFLDTAGEGQQYQQRKDGCYDSFHSFSSHKMSVQFSTLYLNSYRQCPYVLILQCQTSLP